MNATALVRTPLRRIGQIDISVVTRETALTILLTAIEDRRPSAWGFCNAHTVNVAESDCDFRKTVQTITMFNDGVGVDIASKWLYGAKFPENLNGTDLTPELLDLLPKGTSIYLVGGKTDVVLKAASMLAAAHPNIRIAGCHHGYFAVEESDAVVDQIRASDARLVLVGMGHPRQEKWVVAHSSGVNAPMLCVGAFIDRAAGLVPRAPLWMRNLNIEWLFRLAIEPRRLAKRYIWGNVVFLYRVRRQRALGTARLQIRA